MARSSTTATSTGTAPKKGEFVQLVKKVKASKTKSSEETKSQSEMIAAVEHAHPGVTQSIVKLDKMDPVKRAEWLFQFDVCREYMEWEKSEPSLGLSDRPGGDDVKTKPRDDDRDFRPAYLKQPGASAAPAEPPSTVTQLNPAKRNVKDAADAAEKNLSEVGRGKPDPTKH